MKRFLKVLAAALPLVVGSLALAAAAPKMDQIAATKHNFNRAGGTYSAGLGMSATGEKYTICQPCHTPHHAILDATGARDSNISSKLWNHAMSTTDYKLYDGSTAAFTTQVDGSQGMDKVSRLCLGCHDGTVALDAFGMDGRTTNTANKFAANDINNLGTDFRDDHPIGLKAQVADSTGAVVTSTRNGVTSPSFKTPTVTVSSGKTSVAMPVVGAAYDTNLALYTITGSSTGGFYVGCRTCHNPHGTGAANLQPYSHLLNCDPALLCNSCHYK